MTSLTWNQICDSFPKQLSIPSNINQLNNLDAALAYAQSGWYVIPVKSGTKNPGSILGKDWPTKSTRDPNSIKEYFKNPDISIAVNAGKSGAIVFDVDNPLQCPTVLTKYINSLDVPFQSTRRESAQGRGHYFFKVPPGLRYGNGLGKLPTGWGDIRSHNAVVLVTPSAHPSPDGHYQFIRTGELPYLPTEIGIRLSQRMKDSAPSVDSETAREFVAKHSSEDYPELLQIREINFLKNPPIPGSRHYRFTPFILELLTDSAVGFYKASDALDVSQRLFNSLVPPEEQQPREFIGMLLWAIGQINAMNPLSLHLHKYINAPHLDSEVLKWVNTRGR
jgi:hypothetical protein